MQSSATQYNAGEVKLFKAEQHLEQNRCSSPGQAYDLRGAKSLFPHFYTKHCSPHEAPCGFGSAPDITLTLSYTSSHISWGQKSHHKPAKLQTLLHIPMM